MLTKSIREVLPRTLNKRSKVSFRVLKRFFDRVGEFDVVDETGFANHLFNYITVEFENDYHAFYLCFFSDKYIRIESKTKDDKYTVSEILTDNVNEAVIQFKEDLAKTDDVFVTRFPEIPIYVGGCQGRNDRIGRYKCPHYEVDNSLPEYDSGICHKFGISDAKDRTLMWDGIKGCRLNEGEYKC